MKLGSLNIEFRYAMIAYLLHLTILFVSCNTDVCPLKISENLPIAITSIDQEELTITRASQPVARDFTLWGYKSFGKPATETQTVFKQYTVRYLASSAGLSMDNSNNYSYVDETLNQDIKFWDFNASEYNFWGYTGGNYNESSNTLTISDLTQSLTEPAVTDKMFSALYHREPVTNQVVQLQFMRPYAKVRVMFFCSDAIDDGDRVEIGESAFGPESTNQLVTRGTLKVTYPKSGNKSETYETVSTATGASLNFKSVNLTHHIGTTSDKAALAVPTGGTDYYYVIPNKYNCSFTLSTTVDGEVKTAIVPAELMQWLPNYTYTYLFKITESGKKMDFYDVMIEPWKYGGSQKEEWKNW